MGKKQRTQDDEALRYLDAMHQLLKLVKANDKVIAQKLLERKRLIGSVHKS